VGPQAAAGRREATPPEPESPQPPPARPGPLTDRIANRALLLIALTAVGVAVYALSFAVFGPQGPVHTAGAVLVGGALAAVLLLVRDRLQRGVDWLLYGDRKAPERAILRVGRQAEAVTDPDALLDALARTLAETLRLSYLEVVLDDGPAGRPVGVPTRRTTEVDLVHQGRRLGALRAGRRGESLGRPDVQVLAGAAPLLAAAVQTFLLQRSLAAARERVVRAREEERRRLRRDLHDVLGPALAGVGLGLDAARSRARRDPAAADELISQVQDEVRGCVAEIRKIIEGLRPPVLDELGLPGALRQHAALIASRRPGLRIDVVGDVPPGLPAAVEVSAWLIGQEAVTNAVRHARPSRVVVALAAGPEDLRLEVRDDGSGLSPQRRIGVGLISRNERATEIGGELTVGPAPGGGTLVAARLPLTAMEAAAAPVEVGP
jgi:signal transduction histidine kinase